jgi:hypothetical protein
MKLKLLFLIRILYKLDEFLTVVLTPLQNNALFADGKKFAFSGGYVWLQVSLAG